MHRQALGIVLLITGAMSVPIYAGSLEAFAGVGAGVHDCRREALRLGTRRRREHRPYGNPDRNSAYDANGNPLPDFTIVSGSGALYGANGIESEPGTFLLLGVGFVGLGVANRRIGRST
jgi:hypothetical protein